MKNNVFLMPEPGQAPPSAPPPTLVSRLVVGNPDAFRELYDRYAPLLLGVIQNILGDRTTACIALQTTFVQIKARVSELKANDSALLPWLLAIARQTATDAKGQFKKADTPDLYLSPSGSVRFALPTASSAESTLIGADNQLRQLLDAVLLKNCTPEEAAALVGLPVAEARRYLRLAMQQLQQA